MYRVPEISLENEYMRTRVHVHMSPGFAISSVHHHTRHADRPHDKFVIEESNVFSLLF